MFRTRACPLGLVGQRVLVVEDNELNQYVILNMLARFGVETCVAENGGTPWTAMRKIRIST